eukprot:scaffold230588_cov19-Tisochrysis_lutea.AAC.1
MDAACVPELFTQAELDDTNGIELVQGRAAGRGRSMIAVKREKLERAQNFARVMKELTMLGRFIRLADYLAALKAALLTFMLLITAPLHSVTQLQSPPL